MNLDNDESEHENEKQMAGLSNGLATGSLILTEYSARGNICIVILHGVRLGRHDVSRWRAETRDALGEDEKHDCRVTDNTSSSEEVKTSHYSDMRDWDNSEQY
jgi:hypothetical protein